MPALSQHQQPHGHPEPEGEHPRQQRQAEPRSGWPPQRDHEPDHGRLGRPQAAGQSRNPTRQTGDSQHQRRLWIREPQVQPAGQEIDQTGFPEPGHQRQPERAGKSWPTEQGPAGRTELAQSGRQSVRPALTPAARHHQPAQEPPAQENAPEPGGPDRRPEAGGGEQHPKKGQPTQPQGLTQPLRQKWRSHPPGWTTGLPLEQSAFQGLPQPARCGRQRKPDGVETQAGRPRHPWGHRPHQNLPASKAQKIPPGAKEQRRAQGGHGERQPAPTDLRPHRQQRRPQRQARPQTGRRHRPGQQPAASPDCRSAGRQPARHGAAPRRSFQKCNRSSSQRTICG